MPQHRWDTAPGAARNPAPDGGEDRNGRGRRWAFSLPAAVLAVCLLLGCGVAALLLRDRDPVPVATVDLPTSGGPSAPSPAGNATSGAAGLESGGPTAATQPAAPEPTGTPAAGVVVHVAGAVQRPGVVTLKPGSRIVDAVDAAGGTAADADLAAVNLAAVVEDGAMVFVPRIGEEAPVTGTGGTGGSAPGGGSGGGSGGGGATGPAPGSINLNTADSAQLQTLPRVGPVLAERIIAWRTNHGRFLRPEDLDAVPGIGEAMMAALLPLVTV